MFASLRIPDWFPAAMAVLLAIGMGGRLIADDHAVAPPYGTFPAAGAGVSLIGELINIDPINRRGLLRPGGDVAPDRYNRFLGQPFALLPYGRVYYHGAPAELKDVPLGTVLHGVFFQPPPEDNSVPRPMPKDPVARQRAAYFNQHTHAAHGWPPCEAPGSPGMSITGRTSTVP